MRLGCEQPRIFTPPLRELTPETSWGFSVIEFSDQVLEVELLPWQKWFFIHALERRESDGGLRFRTIVLLVARQNGKSTVGKVLALWLLYIFGTRLILGTAQDLDVAEDLWDQAVELAQDDPDLAEEIKRVVQVNGKKALELHSGQRYQVKAANRRGGRGKTADVVLLDELREHQSWEAWAAITKTTLTIADALVLCLSNAGDATSVVLRHLRLRAHIALGDPDGIATDEPAPERDEDDDDALADDDLAIFEWSAPPGAGRWDRDAWAQANPSMNYTLPERNIASAASGAEPDSVFFPENMCQWWHGAVDGPFPEGTWEAGTDATSEIPLEAPVIHSVDVSWNRSMAYVGAAGYRDDGLPHVEVVAKRAGTEWVRSWFADQASADNPMTVVLQVKGAPAGSLVAELREIEHLTVVEWGGSDLGAGCGQFYDAVIRSDEESGVRHRPQPVLDVAAATAVTKPLGDSWAWDRRKSPIDAAPLLAVTAAFWYLNQPKDELPPSAYEERDLTVA